MKKIAVKLGACALSVCMFSAVFAGCGQKDDPRELSATGVTYRDDGAYTTTVLLDDGVGKIKPSDVEVHFQQLDKAAYDKAVKEADEETVVSEYDYYADTKADVKEVTVADDSLTVSFEDSAADENRTDSYTVYIPGKNLAAYVAVEFNTYTVTPDVDSVLATSSTNKITLQLDEGEFVSNAPKDVISLRGSFEDMTVESVSSSGKNLTVQLKGAPNKIEYSNAYVDGVIDVDESAIKDAGNDITVNIPIKEQAASFLSGELEISGGNVYVPLRVVDCGTPIDDIKAADITFLKYKDLTTREEAQSGTEAENDITCTAVRKTDGETLLLTLNVAGASDKNTVAAMLDGKKVKIKDYEFTASFSSASFYPVFDYVEAKENSEKLEFTLELYAHSGEFAGGLKADEFTLGGDFSGATGISVKNTGDTTAELKFSVPSQGQTAENLNMDGTVTVAAGALKNLWGTPSSSAVDYTRNYSQDSLGKDLSAGDIDKIKEIVGGFGNTTFGTITSVASGVASGASAIMTILDLVGLVPSQATQTLTILDDIATKITDIQNMLKQEMAIMQTMQEDMYNTYLSTFDTEMSDLNKLNNDVYVFYQNAREDFKDELTEPAPLPEKPTDKEKADYQAAWAKYASDLIDKIEAAERNNNSRYKSFTDTCNQLIQKTRNVSSAVSQTSSNPMAVYDKLCTLIFNYDTQTFAPRTSQRMNIKYNLEKAFTNIAVYYKCDMSNPIAGEMATALDTVEKLLNSTYTVGKGDGANAYCYTKDMKFPLYMKLHSGVCNKNNNSAIAYVNKDFQESERNNYVKRMNGRTFQQELDLAGFSLPKQFSDGDKIEGMAFYIWTENDGPWGAKKCGYLSHRYCYELRWNDTQMHKEKVWSEWNDVWNHAVGLWICP